MMSKMIEPITFTVPLSFEAHDIAQQCAEKSIPTRFKQVYLNTLAVYAVDSYLRCMGFETNLENSESRDSVMLKFVDVADLDVGGVGKIECRPVLPDAENCHIPYDAWGDRIGYVAVQLDQSLKRATLLGFTRTVAQEVPLTEMNSLEDLLAYMNKIKQLKPVNLMNWFEDVFESGWQVIDELLNPKQLQFRSRSDNALPIDRGQKIDLGMQLAEHSVALLVTIPPEPDSELDIVVEVHPMGNQTYLPPGLQLMLTDESSAEVILQTESREADNFLKFEFTPDLRELFSITVALGEVNVKQSFRL
ncbi:DUF1822 family protein [Microcoleus sp. ARI1-B5]|uniref:DUF1822 family protein n=1 Tax=unclassified Microcoleus TaxID=2642155 RepID=UPI002FD53C8B